MKTPDDIKKGLEYCGHQSRREVCHKCPYDVTMEDCIAWLTSEALAYIQQLEAEKEQVLTKNKQLETKCHQLERERDAAVDYLAMTKDCKTCKHFSHAASEEPCRSCGVRQANWEWRGVKEEGQ